MLCNKVEVLLEQGPRSPNFRNPHTTLQVCCLSELNCRLLFHQNFGRFWVQPRSRDIRSAERLRTSDSNPHSSNISRYGKVKGALLEKVQHDRALSAATLPKVRAMRSRWGIVHIVRRHPMNDSIESKLPATKHQKRVPGAPQKNRRNVEEHLTNSSLLDVSLSTREH